MNTDYQLAHVSISSVPWVLSRTITIHWMLLYMIHDEDTDPLVSLEISTRIQASALVPKTDCLSPLYTICI